MSGRRGQMRGKGEHNGRGGEQERCARSAFGNAHQFHPPSHLKGRESMHDDLSELNDQETIPARRTSHPAELRMRTKDRDVPGIETQDGPLPYDLLSRAQIDH